MYPGILPRCPTKNSVPDFPCPGHHKHSTSSNEQKRRSPCGRAEVLIEIAVISDFRYTSGDELSLRCLKEMFCTLKEKHIKKMVQLGGILNSTACSTKKDLSSVLSDLQVPLANTPIEILNVLGDEESAVRTDYLQSFFAKTFRELSIVRNPSACCGSAYYTIKLQNEYVLIVLDGYELLTIDTNQPSGCKPNGGYELKYSGPKTEGRKCSHCTSKSESTNRVGWAAELQPETGPLNEGDFAQLPRFRYAVSEQQLKWLNLQLQEATRRTENVIIACHIPLHPLLVKDRSVLPVNWKDILYLIMNFNCVRLVLSGRPAHPEATPPDLERPFQYDHGILYYSMPPAWKSTEERQESWNKTAFLLVQLGYDFIRIESAHLCGKKSDETVNSNTQLTLPFEPRRKLRVNNFDYAFNGGYDY